MKLHEIYVEFDRNEMAPPTPPKGYVLVENVNEIVQGDWFVWSKLPRCEKGILVEETNWGLMHKVSDYCSILAFWRPGWQS